MSVYSNLVIADGASNFWRLNEPSGTTAVDVIGGKNGTISGGVTLNQPGALTDGDKAMTFDGTTGKIVTAASVLLSPFTIELWIRRVNNAIPNNQVIFCNSFGSGDNLVIWTRPDELSMYNGISGTNVVFPYDTQWHHLACIFAVGVAVKAYIDGTARTVSDPTPMAFSAGTVKPFEFGFDPNWVYFNGALDDVAIYPSALTPAQIAAHYTVGKIGKTAPTTYADRVILDGASNYWRLNEPSGTTAVDIIGGANGTISGGVTLNQPGALSDGDKAMKFNGTTGKIATAADVAFLVPCTLELWFKTSSSASAPGDADPLFGMMKYPYGSANTTDDDTAWTLRLTPVGEVSIYTVSPTDTSPNGTSQRNRLDDGQWHHLVMICASTSSTSFYLDGVLLAPQAAWPGLGLVASHRPVEIGYYLDASLSFSGALDDVAIYPVALTPAQIAAHYQARLLSGSRRPLPAFVLAHRRFPS